MKSRHARFAKYLIVFVGLFFFAGVRYCWADPSPGEDTGHIVQLSLGEGLVVVLEMFLLRWLLEISLLRALGTSLLANLASVLAGPTLFDFSDSILSNFGWFSFEADNPLATLLYFLIPLIFAIPLEGIVIGVLNWQAGGKRILKASVIVNCISYPLFWGYMVLVMR